MRVLQVNTVCKSGSTGKIAYDIHKSLLQDGHESAICYGRGPTIEEPNLYKFSNPFGVKIHALITRIFGLHGLASNWSTYKLIRYIKAFNPDVVHLHNLHGYYVNMYSVMDYLKKNNIKTIWTFHDEYMYTGNCGYAYECKRWKNNCERCKNLKEYPKAFFLDCTRLQHNLKRNTFENFENLTIITPSKWLKDRAKQSFLKDKNIKVIHNGIDMKNVFYPRRYEELKQKYKITTEKIILAVVPSFSDERKGGKYILELAETLRERNLKIIIIGVNEPIENLPHNVIALSRTENQEELAKYYSMADVFVITSKFETFSMVCVEALACGTPVVGFDAGAPKEIIPKAMGDFVTFGDVESLARVILKRLPDKQDDNQDSLSKACNEYASKNYSKELMYEKYKEIYSTI